MHKKNNDTRGMGSRICKVIATILAVVLSVAMAVPSANAVPVGTLTMLNDNKGTEQINQESNDSNAGNDDGVDTADDGSASEAPAADSSETYNPNADPIVIDNTVKKGVTVSLTDKNGKPITSGTVVNIGDTFNASIAIDFNEVGTAPSLEQPNVQYVIPNETTPKTGSGTLYDSANHPAGTWELVNDTFVLHYSEQWLREHPSNITAHINFELSLDEDKIDKPGDETIVFPGTSENITITIEDSDVDGKKKVSFDSSDNTFAYTIELKVKDFDANNVQVTDTLGNNLSFVEGSFQLNGQPLGDGQSVAINGQTATITLGTLTTPAGKDTTYTLTYKAKLSQAALDAIAKGEKPDQAQNTAKWTWHAGSDELPKPVDPPSVKYQMIEKTGSDNKDGTITWRVKLNYGAIKADMAGYTFTDTLQNKGDLGMTYAGDYTVTDKTTGQQFATGSLPSDGSQSFTYKFPDSAEAHEYEITYTTKLDDVKNWGKYENKGEIENPGKPGGEDGGSVDVTPQDGQLIDKTLTGNTASTDGKASWKSVIKTSAMKPNTKPSDITYEDNVSEGQYQPHIWFDTAEEPQLTFKGQTLIKGTDYTLEWTQRDYWNNNVNKPVTSGFKVTFLDGGALDGQIGQTDQDVAVTYNTVCDKTGNLTYTNTGIVHYGQYRSSDSDNYIIESAPQLTKTGELSWKKDYQWSKIDPNDATVGAWRATWTVKVNEDSANNRWGLGQVDLMGKGLTIVDTLPANMSYDPNSIGYKIIVANNPNGHREDINEKHADPSWVSVKDGQLIVQIPASAIDKLALDGKANAYVELSYSTVAKASVVEGSTATFTNSAQANAGDIQFPGTTTTITKEQKVLDKSASTSGKLTDKSHVKYTIKVNPTGRDLVKGSDTVTLSDTLDWQASFIPSTLQVTDTNTGNTVMVPVKAEDVTDKEGNPTTKITLTLPDSRAITVVYEVSPIGSVGDKVTLKNSASLFGVEEGSDSVDRDVTIEESSASTTGDAGAITITKTDSADWDRHLKGATFQLYEVDLDKLAKLGESVTEEQVARIATQFGSDVITGADGVAQFGSKDHPLENDVLYYFVETKAPEGYEITNGSFHYVMLKGDTDDSLYQKNFAIAKAHGISPSAATSYTAYDEKKPEQGTGNVTLGKQLTGREWKEGEAFDFTLSPKTDDSSVSEADLKAAMPQENGQPKTTFTASKPASGNTARFDVGQFTFTKAGTYVYTVKENKAGQTENHLTHSSKTATITFTVTSTTTQTLNVATSVTGLDDLDGTPSFKNTYKPEPTTAELRAQKSLVNTTFDKTGSFTFQLAATGGTLSDGTTVDAKNVPMPQESKNGVLDKTVSDDQSFSFGTMKYEQAGTYVYTISEITPESHLVPGLAYSNALYTATVTVSDNNGQLESSVKLRLTEKDDGTPISKDEQSDDDDNIATITNTYSDSEGVLGLVANKAYVDHSGNNPLMPGKFEFKLTALGGSTAAGQNIAAANVPMPEGAADNELTQGVANDSKAVFPNIKYTLDSDNGNTYRYQVSEVVPAGVTRSEDSSTATLNGMTYDLATYIVEVHVAYDSTQKVLNVTRTIKVGDDVKDNITFSNEYRVQSASIDVQGSKTLIGRDLRDGESVNFELRAANDGTAQAQAAASGLKDDSIVFGDNKDAVSMEQTVTGLQNGQSQGFTFSGVHFSKPGTYKFTVLENRPNAQGVSIDTHHACDRYGDRQG